MPPKEKTQKEKQIEKSKILNCALNIISTEGFNSLSMRYIGKKLNFSATKIYSYFHNKDEIYIALVVESFRILIQNSSDDLVKCNTPKEKIQCFIKSIIRFSKEYPYKYELLFDLKSPKYLDYINTPLEKVALEKHLVGFEWFNLLKKTVEDYVNYNSFKLTYDFDTTALLFFSFIHGSINLYHNKIVYEVCKDPDKYLDILAESALNNIDAMLNISTENPI
ncbi:TetR/AcrR family transcriptional regulator [Tepidibacter sp. Z1-5]|uniref:TetR/AcrR family transcriptional regulator n=1 Tax=Tepidibacter sp. Z1-5 TaxID=3134138 RepID=UPI0030BBE05A